jgi:hypothetical protein
MEVSLYDLYHYLGPTRSNKIRDTHHAFWTRNRGHQGHVNSFQKSYEIIVEMELWKNVISHFKECDFG